MAIWQYKIYFLPFEEVKSYFPDIDCLSETVFNEIEWWKYRQLDQDVFKDVLGKLKIGKSWSNEVIIFGALDSNCFEILTESKKIVEVSARIDLRCPYEDMIKQICLFGTSNNLILLNYRWNFIFPQTALLKSDIASYPFFNDFLDRTS